MYLDQVKQQIKALKLALPDELLGCKENEILGLEQQLGISLPAAYQEFLLWMGHGASTVGFPKILSRSRV